MGKEKIILTGDRPTGKLHIGHYVGSLKRRVELQNSGLFDKTFIIEARIVGQITFEMFGTAEGIQICKYGITFDFARVLHP